MRKCIELLIAIFIIPFLMATLPATAQNATDEDAALWTAWLYNAADGRMTLLDDSGEVRFSFNLELPVNYRYYPFDVAVSTSGARVGYVTLNDKGGRYVRVYDVLARKILFDYDLGRLLENAVGLSAEDTFRFNETTNALAFGYSMEAGGWQIVVLDLATRQITLTLRGGSPLAQRAGIPTQATPIIQRYQSGQVIFSVLAENAESGIYIWDLTNNQLSTGTAYPTQEGDLFTPTGELLLAVTQPDREGSDDEDPEKGVNALYVYQLVQHETRAFFNAPDLALHFPRFVENGARILFGGTDAKGQVGWLIIERSGAGVGIWQPATGTAVSSIKGTADGFIYTAETLNADGGHSTVFYVNTTEPLAPGVPLWSSPANSYPHLVWVGDTRLTPAAASKPWARITPSSP